MLSWAVLLAAAGLYAWAHSGVLAATPGGEPLFPWPDLPAPRGGLAPWAVLAGALAGGALVARRFEGVAPRGVVQGVAAYAVLVVPVQVLDLVGWALGRGLFRPWLWVLAVGLSVLGIAVLPRSARASRPEASGTAPERDPLVRWLAAAGLSVAALYLHGLGRTIHHGARSWDGESYHLPVPLQWIHLASLTEPLARLVPFSPWEIDRFANPGDGHLLLAVPLLAGWDLVAWVAQLPFAALGAWAASSLSRAAGASRGAAALAGLAFASAPIVAEQAAVPMQDLATGALSLTALAVLSSRAEEASPPWGALSFAGLALGLALGTKTTALAHVGLVLSALALSRWPWASSPRRALLALGLLGAVALVPSYFWYLRSAVLLRNPIHPMAITLFGRTLAEGVSAEDMSGTWDVERMKMTTRWDWLVFPFRDPEYSDETGFGALLVALGALALVSGGAALLAGLRERRLTGERRLAVLAVTGLAIFWLVAVRTPRFNLPLLGLLAALAAPAVDRIAPDARSRRAVGLLVTALVAVTLRLSLVYHGWDMGPPEDRREDLEQDYPGIPAGVDGLPPAVIFNDVAPDEGSRPSNYKLFGRDHRHLVFDHPKLPVDDPAGFVARLRQLGADHVFLRTRKGDLLPARYATAALEPVLRFEGRQFRSVVYRVR